MHILAAWDKIEKVQSLANDEYRRILCTRLSTTTFGSIFTLPSHGFFKNMDSSLDVTGLGLAGTCPFAHLCFVRGYTPQLSRFYHGGCSISVARFSYWIFAPCYLHFVHRHSQNFCCCGWTPSHGVILKLDILNGWGSGKAPFHKIFEFFRLELAFSIAFLCIMHVIAGFEANRLSKFSCCSSLRWLCIHLHHFWLCICLCKA